MLSMQPDGCKIKFELSLHEMTGTIDHYAIVGNPVAHSLSPKIHSQFAKQTGQLLDYTAILAPVDNFAETIAQFHALGGRGVNVTVPFKEMAYQLSNELSDRARTSRAVNTLLLDTDAGYYGDNTDGVGLLTDIKQNLGITLTNRRILLLGAGGAARGVTGPLLAENPEVLVVANRTANRAIDLAQDFINLGPICGQGLDSLGRESAFDLIINATTASLTGHVLALPCNLVSEQTSAYDMVYASKPTHFMRWAASCGGAGTYDGLGMLVEQAAESFFLWRGVRPQTPAVIADLRAFLNAAYA